MAMTTLSLLERIPNEILLIILGQISDLPTLRNFTIVLPELVELYQTPWKEILIDTILREQGSLQITKLICTVISIRNNPNFTAVKDMHQYLRCHLGEHLEDETTKPIIDNVTDPRMALQHIANISNDIKTFCDSFVAFPVQESATRISRVEDACSMGSHRIHLAFWRLQVTLELYKRTRLLNTRLLVQSPADNEDPPDCLYLANHLNHNALDEVQWVYHHICDQYQRLKVEGDDVLCETQSPFIQRLLTNFGYEPGKTSPCCLAYSCDQICGDANNHCTNMENNFSKVFCWAWEWLIETYWS